MTIQIHPAGNQKEYTELLLTLLTQACIPALLEEILPEKEGGSTDSEDR